MKSGIQSSGKPWKITTFLNRTSCPQMKNIFCYATLPSDCFLFSARSHSPLLCQRPDPVASSILIASTVPGLGTESEGNYGYVNTEKLDGDVLLKEKDEVKEESRTGYMRKFCCSHILIYKMLSSFIYWCKRHFPDGFRAGSSSLPWIMFFSVRKRFCGSGWGGATRGRVCA